MSDKTQILATSSSPGSYETAQRAEQTGNQKERRPGLSPLSGYATGPHAPYGAGDRDGAAAIKHDAEGQYAKSRAKPNASGLGWQSGQDPARINEVQVGSYLGKDDMRLEHVFRPIPLTPPAASSLDRPLTRYAANHPSLSTGRNHLAGATLGAPKE